MPQWIGKPSERRTSFGGLPRSELMARVRSTGNQTTELKMMSLLRHFGIVGWRRHAGVSGRPDFSWPAVRVAVFVHGCFWHGHDCGRNLRPRSNAAEWRAKIARNRRRDARSARALRLSGWSVVTVWECRLSETPDACVRRIERAVSARLVPSEVRKTT